MMYALLRRFFGRLRPDALIRVLTQLGTKHQSLDRRLYSLELDSQLFCQRNSVVTPCQLTGVRSDPNDLSTEVVVDVHESRGNDQSGGIDHPSVRAQLSDYRGDSAIVNGQIAFERATHKKHQSLTSSYPTDFDGERDDGAGYFDSAAAGGVASRKHRKNCEKSCALPLTRSRPPSIARSGLNSPFPTRLQLSLPQ